MAKTLFVRLLRGLLAAAVLVAATAVPALAQNPRSKLDDVLRTRARQLAGSSRVIVQFRGEPDVRAITSRRGRAGRQLRGARAQVADIDNRSIEDLANDPRVERIVVDREAFATMERTGATIGATLARQQFGVTGQGIGVAVIDSGITADHDDLNLASTGRSAPRIAAFRDFTLPDGYYTGRVSDDFGHGSHVAGIIAGSGYDSSGKRMGIAPGVRLVGLKVLDAEGHGYISDVIEALDYAVSIKDRYNIRVINLSVGAGIVESYRTDPLAQAAKRAVDAGIVVVAAAGNLGRNASGETQYGGITSPGNAPWVLTVGADSHQGTVRRSDDAVASFSSRGPTWIDFGAKPDLIAPGVGIESISDPHSTLARDFPALLLSGTRFVGYRPYISLSGTSMATPVVAGTVALMLEQNPTLTPNAVKAILQYTAQRRAGEPTLAQGAGLLNAEGALRMARFFQHPRTGLGPAVDALGGESVPWSKQIIWGNYVVSGGVPLPGSNAWALTVSWGAMKTRLGSPIVWGAVDADNIVWSTSRDSDNIVWSTADRDAENIVWSTAARDEENIVWSTAGSDNIVWSTAGADSGNIVWSTADRDAENIVWSTVSSDADNIVWSTADRDSDNIVWSTATFQNVVWGADCGGRDCQQVVWGAHRGGAVMGTASGADNIVWSTAVAADDSGNIVWSTASDDSGNIVWSTASRGDEENIVWSTASGDRDNIVWSTGAVDQVLWPADSPQGSVTEKRK